MITGILIGDGLTRKNRWQAAKFRDKPLLQYPIEAMQGSKLDQIFLVLGKDYHVILNHIHISMDKTTIVMNHRYDDRGLSSYIRAAMSMISHQSEAVMIALGEYPFLTSSLIDKMIDTYRQNRGKIIVPVHGKEMGQPVIYDKNYFESIRRLMGSDVGGSVLHKHNQEIIGVEVKNPGAVLGIDRIQELESINSAEISTKEEAVKVKEPIAEKAEEIKEKEPAAEVDAQEEPDKSKEQEEITEEKPEEKKEPAEEAIKPEEPAAVKADTNPPAGEEIVNSDKDEEKSEEIEPEARPSEPEPVTEEIKTKADTVKPESIEIQIEEPENSAGSAPQLVIEAPAEIKQAQIIAEQAMIEFDDSIETSVSKESGSSVVIKFSEVESSGRATGIEIASPPQKSVKEISEELGKELMDEAKSSRGKTGEISVSNNANQGKKPAKFNKMNIIKFQPKKDKNR